MRHGVCDGISDALCLQDRGKGRIQVFLSIQLHENVSKAAGEGEKVIGYGLIWIAQALVSVACIWVTKNPWWCVLMIFVIALEVKEK